MSKPTETEECAYIHRGNAYRLEDGALFTAAVLLSGEPDTDWCEVMEIEEYDRAVIMNALVK